MIRGRKCYIDRLRFSSKLHICLTMTLKILISSQLSTVINSENSDWSRTNPIDILSKPSCIFGKSELLVLCLGSISSHTNTKQDQVGQTIMSPKSLTIASSSSIYSLSFAVSTDLFLKETAMSKSAHKTRSGGPGAIRMFLV